jgi:hypothetical protein
VDPERTYAVVVGIEKYRLAGSDLNGPAEDAIAFVEWLRQHGVPATHILLFCSPLAAKEAQLHSRLDVPAVAVSAKAAEKVQIEDCLVNTLKESAQFDADLLYFFWGGHGIADDAENRYLFYADTTEDTLNRHFHVPTGLGLLASYRHFPKQIVYIDTCANLKPQWKLGANKFAFKAPNAKQSVFFAASIGQRAANNDVERSGKFSQALRATLAEVEAEDQSWPPSPTRVIQKLRTRFRDDRTQKPIFYDAGDFEGDHWTDGELPASEFVEYVAREHGYAVRDLRTWALDASRSNSLMLPSNRDRILRTLEREADRKAELGPILGDGFEDWLRTFATAIDYGVIKSVQNLIVQTDPYAKPLAQKISTAEELNGLDRMLEEKRVERDALKQAYLQTMEGFAMGAVLPQNRREILRTLPLSADDVLRFVAEFVLRLNIKREDPELRDWVKRKVRLSTLEEIEAKLRAEAENQTYYLFFWIKPNRISPMLFRGKRFEFVRKWPSCDFQMESLGELVDRYLSETEQQYSQNLRLQFLVSHEYFSWNPQTIPIKAQLGGTAPLGSTYPTVMRWRERTLGLPRTRHQEWAQRAEKILKCASTCPVLSCGWIAEDLDANNLKDLLRAVGTKHHVVAFDFSPPPILKNGINPLMQAIFEGIPVILWPCVNPADRAEIRKVLDVCTGKHSLMDLMEKMKEFYETEQGKWKVTLFWDNPQEKPEKWEYVDL